MITRGQAADFIDTSWHYSRYWPNDDWERAAIADAEKELARAEIRASRLRYVISEMKKQEAHDATNDG